MKKSTCCSHSLFKEKRRYFQFTKGSPSTYTTLMKVTMRIHIAAFLIVISCLNAFSEAKAQKVTLQLKQVELETVFRAIEKQTDYSFAYGVSLLADSKPVTVQLNKVNLTEALDQIFADLPYRYEIVNKTILIKAKVQANKQSTSEKTPPIRVRGRVTDKNNAPLPAVSIRVRETNVGTVTDANGNYSIEAEPDAILIFSSVGFQTMQIKINGKTEHNLTLIENEAQLNETVIKGYYQTTKELNTGNVSTVKAGDLARQPISDPLAALIGRVPGLFIQQQNGVPGREFTVQLRGQNSLANGNNPLYIVDGIQFQSNSMTITGTGSGGTPSAPAGGAASPFNYINPNDIESIDILKDADATAIYGSRGANGVILITTKKGKAGKTQLEANVYTGFSKAIQRVKYMTTPEYLTMRRSAFANDNKMPGVADYDLNGTWDTTSNTNWQDLIMGNSAKLHQGTLTVTGGGPTTTFRIGATYRTEGTVYPGDFSAQKSAFQFSVNHRTPDEKIKIDFSGSYVNSDNNLPTDFTASTTFTFAPNLPKPYNADGTLNWAPTNQWSNPMALFLKDSNENAKNLISNVTFTYEPIKNLELKSSFGYNTIDFSQISLNPFSSSNPYLGTLVNPSTIRTNAFLENSTKSWLIEPQASYSIKMSNGRFDALFGSTFQATDKKFLSMFASGFSSDATIENFASATSVTTRGRSSTKYRYSAVYMRLGYTNQDKYIVNLTARRDGSSRFGPRNKFGNFGAIGVGWVFSKEPFFKKLSSIINYGKLRSSYGITGNDQLPDYQYLDTYSTITSFYQGISSLVPTQLTNPYYGWEKVKKLEVAIELGLFRNNISFNASYYQNRTGNQLVQYALPSIAGFTSVRANLPAVIENSGLEFDLNANIINSKKASWSTSLNLTIPKNKLVSYPNIAASSYANTYAIGEPLSISRGYHFNGFDKNSGLFTFQDLNGDGNITSAFDQIFFFRGQKYYGGLQNTIKYRCIELDFLFQFTKQNGRGYFASAVTPGYFNSSNGNQPSTAINEKLRQPYTQSNTTINNLNSIFNSSDGQLTDASFIRLKNVAISYQLPLLKPNSIFKTVSIYCQAQNLATITNYTGFDPEVPSNGVIIPPLRTLIMGIRTSL